MGYRGFEGARLLGAAIGLAAMVLVLAGCSAEVGGGDDSSDASAELELLIQRQVPGQARKRRRVVTETGAGPGVVATAAGIGSRCSVRADPSQ